MGLLTAAALKGLSLCHVYIQPATAQQVPVFKLLRELPTCGIWEPISSTDGAWPAIGWRPPEAHAGLGLQCRSLRHCCATPSLKLAAQVLAPQRPGWLLRALQGGSGQNRWPSGTFGMAGKEWAPQPSDLSTGDELVQFGLGFPQRGVSNCPARKRFP